jgi:hypothetical protein
MPIIQTKTRGKIKVPLTNKERVRAWREKKAKEGGQNLTVWLEVDTVQKMEILLDRFPKKNKASLVAFAINELYNQTAT